MEDKEMASHGRACSSSARYSLPTRGGQINVYYQSLCLTPPFLPRWTIFLCLSAPSLHWATRGTLCPSPTLPASTSRPIPVQTVVHFSTRRTSGRLWVKSSPKHWRYLTLHGNISTGRCIVYPRPEQFLVVLFDLVSVPKHLYYFSGMACAKQPGCSSCQLASQVNKERGVRGHHSPESQDRSTSCHLEE